MFQSTQGISIYYLPDTQHFGNSFVEREKSKERKRIFNNWFSFYTNLSPVQQSQSDVLCRETVGIRNDIQREIKFGSHSGPLWILQGVPRLVSQVGHPYFLGICWWIRLPFYVLNKQWKRFDFLKIFFFNFWFWSWSGQVQAQPGFQAHPGMQQAQVLHGYSTFWPEKHLTW